MFSQLTKFLAIYTLRLTVFSLFTSKHQVFFYIKSHHLQLTAIFVFSKQKICKRNTVFVLDDYQSIASVFQWVYLELLFEKEVLLYCSPYSYPWGYTRISLSVCPFVCLSIRVQNTTLCQSAGWRGYQVTFSDSSSLLHILLNYVFCYSQPCLDQ